MRLKPESESELDIYRTYVRCTAFVPSAATVHASCSRNTILINHPWLRLEQLPGGHWLRINVLTLVLAIIGWLCHVRGVYAMVSRVNSKAKHKALTSLIIQHNRWGDNPPENAEELLREELMGLSVHELKVRAKELIGHEWDDDDDHGTESKIVNQNLGRNSGVAANSTVIIMQIRSLSATLVSCWLFMNLCELCAFQVWRHKIKMVSFVGSFISLEIDQSILKFIIIKIHLQKKLSARSRNTLLTPTNRPICKRALTNCRHCAPGQSNTT